MARILQVCNTDFYLRRFLKPLIRGLRSAGHTVECVCEGDPGALAEADVPVHPLRFPRRPAPLAFARSVVQMRKVIRRRAYDCVNSHNRNASMVARVAAWLEKVPINLYTAHGFYFHDDQSRAAREATILLEAGLARLTDFTLSQNEEDIRLMVGRGYIPADQIRLIGNGIDVGRFHPRTDRRQCEQQLGLKPSPFRVGALGRLVKAKGFLDLLRAFANICPDKPGAELLLIGGNIEQDISPFHREFVAESGRLGIAEAVVITGITDRVEAYLSACDTFVLPSYREGMPRALLEAMSVGLPAIATDIRGCREIVQDGDNGFLYTPHDVVQLTSLLSRLLGEPELRAKLGRAARSRVVQQFDERDYVARQVEAINQLLGERSAGYATGAGRSSLERAW